jgi:hypothetical protein
MSPSVLATYGEAFEPSRSFAESQEEEAIAAPLSNNMRSVTFQDEYIILYEYEKVGAEQRAELWYPEDERTLIMLRNTLTLNLIQVGCFQESEEQTIRGLERSDPERKHDTMEAVLSEQHRQTAQGVRHPERIAMASRTASHNNRMVARATGLRDAVVAWGKKQSHHDEEKPSTSIEVARGKNQPQHERAVVTEVQSTDVLVDFADTPDQRKDRKGGLMKAMEKFCMRRASSSVACNSI